MLLGQLPSIHDLPPLEQGGPIARAGFLYQDHIGARFCIDMLRNTKLAAVWCETLDDITLIWTDSGRATVEFVQVKSNDLGQMWSVALLCGGGMQSIVARSLAQHRCQEPCCFRIITRVGVSTNLRVLLLARDHADRCIAKSAVLVLHKAIEEHLKGFSSAGGWSASAWFGHTVWEIAESETAIEHSNLLKLEQWLEEIGEPLFSDQRSELYNRILTRVYRASALPHQAAEQKKFARGTYEDWVKVEVHRIRGTAPTKGGTTLVGKMQKANIPDSAVQNALNLRLAYRGRTLTPRYQQEEEYKSAELELTAKLQHLVAHLDVGTLNMNGPEFHARCLDAAGELHERFKNVDLV